MVADAALADAEVHGLVPLQWALACLLSDIGSDTHPSRVIAGIRAESAEIITRRGGNGVAANAIRRFGRYCLAVQAAGECPVRNVGELAVDDSSRRASRRGRCQAVAGSRDALREVLTTIRPIVVRYVRARLGTAGSGPVS